MPRISEFLGIVICMYFNDHAPPHFHVAYGEYEACYDIETLDLRRGGLPRRPHALVVEWAMLHRNELRANWEQALAGLPPRRIEPLG